MREPSRAITSWALFVFVISGMLWLAKLSPSYRECDAEYKQHPAYSESTNSQKERVRRFVLCEGAFLDANSQVITAIATLAIAFFTLTLWRATTRQAGLAEQNISIAREQAKISARLADISGAQFRAEHRPRIRVRYADYGSIDTIAGKVIGAVVHFTNIGPTRARLINVHARIFRALFPTMRDLTTNPGSIEPLDIVLTTGQSYYRTILSEFGDQAEANRTHIAKRQGADAEEIFLFGYIQYLDDAGATRQTGFCWCLDIVRQKWLLATDRPELNYED